MNPAIGLPEKSRATGWLVPTVAGVVLGGALLVLVGWWRDIPVLKSVVPGQVSMKPNTAVGFALLALALGFSRGAMGAVGRRLAPGCVWAVVALGGATLVEYLGDVDLGIDERLFRDDLRAVATSHPGRMAPFTALNFVFAGLAVWLVLRPRWVAVAQGLALGVMLGALFNLVGYLFQSASFYRFGDFTALALHTAVGFWLVGWGVLGVRAEAGLVRRVTGATPTGRLLRRLLLGAVVVPVGFAWLRLQGERAGLYDTAFGLALTTLTTVVVLVGVIWVTARRLEQIDGDRLRTAGELREANERLEQRVVERTGELERVSRLQRAVLDGTVFSVIATEVDGTIVVFNAGAQRLLGYTAEDGLARQSLAELHLPSELAARAGELSGQLGREITPGHETLVALARVGRADEREWTYVSKTGARVPVRLRMSALCDQAGEITGFLAVAQDLSETRAAERALAASEERLHRVLSHADCLVWEAQVTLTETDWNWQMTVHPSGLYRRLTDGDVCSAGVGLWYQFEIPERAEMNERSRAALASGAPGYEQEFQLVRNGRAVWLRETVSITPQQPGSFWVVGVAVDVTERKANDAGLRASEERFRLFAELAPVGICQTDLQGHCTYVNERWCAITGRAAPEALGRNWGDGMHREDRRRVWAVWSRLLHGAREAALEYRFVRGDGSIVWVAGSAKRLTDERGQITGYLGSVTDITAMKAAEQVRRQVSEELTLQKFALDEHAIVAVTDVGGRILRVNEKFCAISQFSQDELVGQNHRMINSGHHPKAFFTEMFRVISSGRVWHGEICNRAKGGGLYWVDTTIVPFNGADGRLAHYIAIRTDITARKELAASYAEARDQALEASRLKSEFLATMSHEIRTPMNAVLGMAGLLEDTPLNSEQSEMVRTMLGGAENLLTIINDILDFSRIEAGKLRLDAMDFDFQRIVEETVALLAPRAREKGLDLACEIAALPEGSVHGDGGRLRQILTNLLGNAIKFTDVGGVVVTVQACSSNEHRCRVRVAVRDSGVGISAEAQRRLFQPFMQADGSTTRRFGGTGLGLAISRQLVALMGGEIGFESAEGQGSLFWFELDFERRRPVVMVAPGEVVPGVAAARGGGRRLLLVEDNEANQRVAAMMLRKLGYELEIAGDGQQALEKLAVGSCDLVLMDCQMPTMDGYEATRRIRAGQVPGLDAKVPIIALTAYARPEDRQRCLDAGMDGYVAKPIREAELRTALERCIGELRLQDRPAAAGEVRPTGEPERVLDAAALRAARELPGSEGASLLPELIRLYLSDESERLEELSRLVHARRGEELGAGAHSLGGNAASFGGVQVRRIALELERVARAEDWPEVTVQWAQLQAACARLRSEIIRLNLTGT